ncbi:chemotaxis protein CheC [bacterium]|nr:chemotaxis protein CheC [bacterium]
MKDPNQINEFYRDALRELGNIGAGNAATALSQLLGRTINMSVPEVMIIPVEKVPEQVGGSEEIVAGIYLEVFGDLPSKILVTFPHSNLIKLTDMLLGQTVGSSELMSEMKLSALKELGTILSGAYLNALAKFLDMRMIPSVPALAIDIMTAILETILVEISTETQYALMLRTEITEIETRISGTFFLIPEAGSLDIIVSAIKKVSGVVDA